MMEGKNFGPIWGQLVPDYHDGPQWPKNVTFHHIPENSLGRFFLGHPVQFIKLYFLKAYR